MNREVFLKQISIKLRNEDDSDICCIYLDKDSIPSQLLGNLSNKIRGIGKHAMCCGPCAESMCLLGGGGVLSRRSNRWNLADFVSGSDSVIFSILSLTFVI